MVEMVKSEKPVWHTFHRAWSACVSLPMYDKKAWKEMEDSAFLAEESRKPGLVATLLRAIETLLSEQGGTYTPV